MGGKEQTRFPMTIGAALASKLASVVVHADELFGPDGRVGFDDRALMQAVHDPEVQEWVKSLGPLAPVKRRK